MNFEDLKRQAAEVAERVRTSEQARKLRDSEQIRRAVGQAAEFGTRAVSDLLEMAGQAQRALDVETQDDLAPLKRRLDALRDRAD